MDNPEPAAIKIVNDNARQMRPEGAARNILHSPLKGRSGAGIIHAGTLSQH
jgi:hypothetical protein